MIDGPVENAIGVKLRAVDGKSVVGRFQRCRLPLPITTVTITHILENVAEHNGLSGGLQLPGAARGADLEIGIDEEFEIGVWQDHAADVAPVENGALTMRWRHRKPALQLDKPGAYQGHGGNDRCHAGHPVSADVSCIGKRRIKPLNGACGCLFINSVSCLARLKQIKGEGPVQRAGIEM